MTEEEYQQLEPFVSQACRSVAAKWPGLADYEDLQQDVWVKVLKSNGTLDALLAMDSGDRVHNLKRMAHRIAAKMRDDYEVFSGNYMYSVGMVRGLLKEGALSYEPSSSGLGRPVRASEGMDFVRVGGGDNYPGALVPSVCMDIKRAFKKLQQTNARHAHLIHKKYVKEERLDKRDQSAADRAVVSLTTLMNRG